MKTKVFKTGISLTLLFAGIVFLAMITVIIVSGVIAGLLLDTGILPKTMTSAWNKQGIFMVLMVVSLFIGAVLSMAVSRATVRQVHKVENAMKQLAKGNFDVRLHFDGFLGNHPDVIEITDSFNLMAEELQHTEILRMDFINDFSHEFKTPIVSIAGFAKLLDKGELTPELQKEYISIIAEESIRLSTMATNVLELSKVENQTILTDTVRYNVSEQLRNCVLLLENKWTAKDIAMNIEVGEYEITANESMLKQVWINLLDNAVKYADPGGSITLWVSTEDDQLLVSVENTGSEIPEASKDKIFNKFYQADESHASEGNGVGLAIVKKVVELHKGRIHCVSENGHTIFTVRLPRIVM